MYVPEFEPRLDPRIHDKHMGRIGTVTLHRFTDESRARARHVNILHVSTGGPDHRILRVAEQMRSWGYSHAHGDVKKDCLDASDPRGLLRACRDADILIVGSSKNRESAARYLLNMVGDGWFGIMPHWDVLWYGLNGDGKGRRARRKSANGKNGHMPEGGPSMFGIGPVRTGPEFVLDAVAMVHAHIRRREDTSAILDCMRSLWNEVSASLSALAACGVPQKAGIAAHGGAPAKSPAGAAALRKSPGFGTGGAAGMEPLLGALKTLESCGGGRGALPAGGRAAEKHAYRMAHALLRWIVDCRAESGWAGWRGRAVGELPKESLLDSVRRRHEWPKLEECLAAHVPGFRLQAMVTELLAAQGIPVTGVECSRPERDHHGCGCNCGGCAGAHCMCGCTICAGNGGYDVDLMVVADRLDVPIQVGSFGCAQGATGRARPRGWDTERIRKKLRQTPPMGMALMICTTPGCADMKPSVNWWYGGVKDKCLALLDASGGKSVIYHSAPKVLVDAAAMVCRALGSGAPAVTRVVPRPGRGECPHFCPDTVEGMVEGMRWNPGRWAADVTGALRYSEYVGAYCNNMTDLAGLAPAVKHAAETYAKHGGEWGRALDGSLDALDTVLGGRRAAPGLADAARALHGALLSLDAERSRNGHAGGHDADAREGRLLRILDCMARTVCRLGAGAPPEVLEALTAAAKGGAGRRAVLGARLGELAAKQPEWYAKNERLLFGASNGLGKDLMGTMMDCRAWQPAMEKYPHLAYAAAPGVVNGSAGGSRMRVLMEYVLNGIRGYDDMGKTVRFLADAGALGAAAEECARLAGKDARYRRAYARLRRAVRECAPEHVGEFVVVKAAKPGARVPTRRTST